MALKVSDLFKFIFCHFPPALSVLDQLVFFLTLECVTPGPLPRPLPPPGKLPMPGFYYLPLRFQFTLKCHLLRRLL
jgi:hypothetical protein